MSKTPKKKTGSTSRGSKTTGRTRVPVKDLRRELLKAIKAFTKAQQRHKTDQKIASILTSLKDTDDEVNCQTVQTLTFQ